MKHNKNLFLICICVLLTGFAMTAASQESDDAMDEFMTAPADDSSTKSTSNPPASTGAEPSNDGVIDMRGAVAPVAAPPPQAHPEIDKIESLMVAEAEMKVFMKAGGLRSRKIK